MPSGLEMTVKMIDGENRLLYASDYPHWDFDVPARIYDLPFLGEQAKRNILGANAARLFNLPDHHANGSSNGVGADVGTSTDGVTTQIEHDGAQT